MVKELKMMSLILACNSGGFQTQVNEIEQAWNGTDGYDIILRLEKAGKIRLIDGRKRVVIL